jgi:hypothetical protein
MNGKRHLLQNTETFNDIRRLSSQAFYTGYKVGRGVFSVCPYYWHIYCGVKKCKPWYWSAFSRNALFIGSVDHWHRNLLAEMYLRILYNSQYGINIYKIRYFPSWSLSTDGSEHSVGLMKQAGKVSSFVVGGEPSTFWTKALRGIDCATRVCWSGKVDIKVY